MTDSTWCVVCPAYVSHHPDEASARRFALNPKGKQCKEHHVVLFSNLPKGSRLQRDAK